MNMFGLAPSPSPGPLPPILGEGEPIEVPRPSLGEGFRERAGRR